METLIFFWNMLLHIDQSLAQWAASTGIWIYLILFLIVFCETGLVIMPYLPGDSLLFAVGTLCATGALHFSVMVVLLCCAAILGDSVNYRIGMWLRPKLLIPGKIPWIKQEHLDRTEHFYARYGSMAIVIARFVPIVRTFAPFVAGVGHMPYRLFFLYNCLGALFWVVGLTTVGYLFGNLPMVKEHFSLVVLGIILISFLPLIVGWWQSRRKPLQQIF